jgi:hypothetical protein
VLATFPALALLALLSLFAVLTALTAFPFFAVLAAFPALALLTAFAMVLVGHVQSPSRVRSSESGATSRSFFSPRISNCAAEVQFM